MSKINYLTQEGFDKLKAELEELSTKERPSISRQIAEARDKGDLSENAEYDAAKEAQGMLEMRISKLEAMLTASRVIDPSMLLPTDCVQILSKVELLNIKTNKTFHYTLVSESESSLKDGKLSLSTPIAQAILGKKVGDEVKVTAPIGELEFRIINVSI